MSDYVFDVKGPKVKFTGFNQKKIAQEKVRQEELAVDAVKNKFGDAGVKLMRKIREDK